jgi:hypothetical protein
MSVQQIALPESIRVSLHNEVMKYVALFPTESGVLIGDRLRYKLCATTACKNLIPPEIPNHSDELEFPLNIVYVPETEEIAKVVTTINNLLQGLNTPKLQYLHAYFAIVMEITYKIPGAF